MSELLRSLQQKRENLEHTQRAERLAGDWATQRNVAPQRAINAALEDPTYAYDAAQAVTGNIFKTMEMTRGIAPPMVRQAQDIVQRLNPNIPLREAVKEVPNFTKDAKMHKLLTEMASVADFNPKFMSEFFSRPEIMARADDNLKTYVRLNRNLVENGSILEQMRWEGESGLLILPKSISSAAVYFDDMADGIKDYITGEEPPEDPLLRMIYEERRQGGMFADIGNWINKSIPGQLDFDVRPPLNISDKEGVSGFFQENLPAATGAMTHMAMSFMVGGPAFGGYVLTAPSQFEKYVERKKQGDIDSTVNKVSTIANTMLLGGLEGLAWKGLASKGVKLSKLARTARYGRVGTAGRTALGFAGESLKQGGEEVLQGMVETALDIGAELTWAEYNSDRVYSQIGQGWQDSLKEAKSMLFVSAIGLKGIIKNENARYMKSAMQVEAYEDLKETLTDIGEDTDPEMVKLAMKGSGIEITSLTYEQIQSAVKEAHPELDDVSRMALLQAASHAMKISDAQRDESLKTGSRIEVNTVDFTQAFGTDSKVTEILEGSISFQGEAGYSKEELADIKEGFDQIMQTIDDIGGEIDERRSIPKKIIALKVQLEEAADNKQINMTRDKIKANVAVFGAMARIAAKRRGLTVDAYLDQYMPDFQLGGEYQGQRISEWMDSQGIQSKEEITPERVDPLTDLKNIKTAEWASTTVNVDHNGVTEAIEAGPLVSELTRRKNTLDALLKCIKGK